MERNLQLVNIDYLYSGILESCHDELRLHFEPMIEATLNRIEVHVLSSITLRLSRLAKATELLCKAGLNESSQMQFRAATEGIVNLLYIMYVGPSSEGKSRSQLAKQFAAYGDIAYFKLLNSRDDKGRSAFKKRYGMSDFQFDVFLSDKKRLSDIAKTSGCSSRRWHTTDLDRMAKMVRDFRVPIVDDPISEKVFSSFVSSNSATHGDALSLRTHYRSAGNAPLELIFEEDHIYADMVAAEALWSWKAIGDYFGELDFVKRCIHENLLNIVNERLGPDE